MSTAKTKVKNFWGEIKTSFTRPKELYPAPKKGAMEFPIGQGLNPMQTKKAQQKVTERDYAAEAKRANSFWGFTENVAKGIPKQTAIVAKDIAQGIARSGGMVGLTLTGQEMPDSKASRFFYGDKPLKDIPGAIQNTREALKPYVGGTGSTLFAPPLVLGSIALDFTGFGGKAGVKAGAEAFAKGEIPEQFLKYMAKEKVPQQVENTLKSIGLDDANSKLLSQQLADTNTVDDVKNVLLNFEKETPVPALKEGNFGAGQPSDIKGSSRYESTKGKVFDAYQTAGQEKIVRNEKGNLVLQKASEEPNPNIAINKITPEVSAEVSKNVDDNLIQEARKYKSADAFVSKRPIETDLKIARSQGVDELAKYKANGIDDMIDDDGYITLYHGGKFKGDTIKATDDELFFLTNNKDEALDYANKNKGKVIEVKTRPEFVSYNTGSNEWEISTTMRKLRDPETLEEIYAPEVTKSQLTDIWNKAQSTQGKAITPVVSEVNKIMSSENIENGLTPTQANVIRGTLSEADRLIAQNKIRVVSRDGRDVYQVKKGGKWANTRDEESAVKQVTRETAAPKPKEYKPEDEKRIVENAVQLENIKETLDNHPAKPLTKYISKKEGEFLDFKNPDKANSEAERQRIIKRNTKVFETAEKSFEGTKYSNVFDDPDAIREAIEDYNVTKQIQKGLLAEKKELKNIKPIEKTKTKPLEKVAQKPVQKVSLIDTTEGAGRSIEIQANQARDMLLGEPVGIDVSLPKIIENTVTDVKHKVHVIDTYLTTPHFVMEKIGFGKEATMLRDAMDSYWKELPKNLDVITEWSKSVPKEANKRIFRYLDGEAITLAPEEKKVATEIRAWLKEWATRLGLKEDNTITYYITHIFDKELLKKEFDEDLAKIIADKIPGSVYDPFLLKRLGKKGYKQDTWAALDAYTKRATRKVHMDPVLELIQSKTGSSLEVSMVEKSQFNYIKKYIENINMRPNEADEGVDNFIKSIIGYKLGQRPTNAITRFFRQATFRGMLGLNPASALRNLSQGANTYAVLGEKYTVIGYAKLFSKGAGEELVREGVLNAGFVQDRALNATKKAIEKMDKVLFVFFDRAEKINRGAAYFGAKAQALSKGKSEAEAINYAKRIVRKTQFVFDSVDTPVGMSSDLLKTLFQFQSYTTKQIEFLGGMAKGTFKGGEKLRNFTGLLRYALAGTAFVYTIGKAFGMEPKEILPWYRFQTPPSLKFPVEATKAIVGAPDKYGKTRDTEKKFRDVANSAIGLIPAGTQIKKTVQGTQAVMEGGSFNKGNRLQFKQGMSLPEKAQSVVFGKYASQEAKDYFDKSETNKSEQKPIKKIYDQVQTIAQSDISDEEKNIQITALLKDFTPEQQEIYKEIRAAEKRAKTIEAEREMMPIVLKVQKLMAEGRQDEVAELLKDFDEEDQRIFKLTRDKLK